MAQVNPLVGDIPGNTRLVLDTANAILAQNQPTLLSIPNWC